MKKKLLVLLALLGWCLLAAGCGPSNFQQNYVGFSAEELVAPSRLIMCEEPQLVTLQHVDVERTVLDAYENGYMAVGWSQFKDASASKNTALKLGRELGACVVYYGEVFDHSYNYTRIESIPIREITTQTVSEYKDKSDGKKKQYIEETTTIEYENVEVEYTQNIYRYMAVYAVGLEPGPFGVLLGELGEAEQKKLGYRYGMRVLAVRKNGTAFQAGVFRDDIITLVNNNEVWPATDFEALFKPGMANTLTLIRDGKTLKKEFFVSGRLVY